MASARTIIEGVFAVGQIIVCVVLSPMLRKWYDTWGCTGLLDVNREFAGDAFVPRPRSSVTCAISIAAAPAAIWPWLVQIGCGRAGWYSYDLLDNAGRPSAGRVLPEHQALDVGDTVPAVPSGSFGFPVAEIRPPRVLVLAGTMNTKTGQPLGPDRVGDDPYFSGGQAFLIEPAPGGWSVLIFRMRVDWNRSLLNTIIYRYVLEPISFVMARKMLLNLRQRAELAALESDA